MKDILNDNQKLALILELFDAGDINNAIKIVESYRAKGKWKNDEYDIPHCSECNCINNTVYKNYCPNCGAEMESEE